MDLWDPYKQASLSGGHYVLTIIDDFDRATSTFLITIDNTSQILSMYLKMFCSISSLCEKHRTDMIQNFSIKSVSNHFKFRNYSSRTVH